MTTMINPDGYSSQHLSSQHIFAESAPREMTDTLIISNPNASIEGGLQYIAMQDEHTGDNYTDMEPEQVEYQMLPLAALKTPMPTKIAKKIKNTLYSIQPKHPIATAQSLGITTAQQIVGYAAESGSEYSLPEEQSVPPSETALVSNFEKLVDGISVADFAIRVGEKPVTAIDRFTFTPLTSQNQLQRSDQTAGYSVNVREGIRTTYEGDGKPYLDAGQAVGLTYEGRLIAVAAAGVDDDGNLKIVQIQDVSGVRKSEAGREFYKTGLHNGMAWRETLVTVWEHIASEIGAGAVIIQSNANNRWDAVKTAGSRGYDDVALRMGYALNPTTRNWVKTDGSVPERATPE